MTSPVFIHSRLDNFRSVFFFQFVVGIMDDAEKQACDLFSGGSDAEC